MGCGLRVASGGRPVGQPVTRNSSRRLAPESRHSSLIFGARSEIIRWTRIDARYLRAYGKSKHSQDTDRASTCAEAIDQKGTLSRSSALTQGQNGTIDQALPGAGSCLAECVASSCGRHPTTLVPPELRTFFTRVGNSVNTGSPRAPWNEANLLTSHFSLFTASECRWASRLRQMKPLNAAFRLAPAIFRR